MAYQVLLIGLGQTGTSLGLALARAEGKIERIGYDPDKDKTRAATASGAVDRVIGQPHREVENTDLIIFDLPHDEVEAHLEYLGPRMKAEAIVIDTAPIRAPFFEWAAQYLPEDRNVIGATPIVGTLGVDRTGPGAVDRFSGGLVAITAPPGTTERALSLAINLAKILDANPFFLDVEEHDAATATVEDLPILLSAAVFQSIAESASWRELQRLAGPQFMHATEACSTNPILLQKRIAANRALLVSRLDLLRDEVDRIRELILTEQDDNLIQYFENADSTRQAWLQARARGDWAAEEMRADTGIEKISLLGQLFGLGQRKPKSD